MNELPQMYAAALAQLASHLPEQRELLLLGAFARNLCLPPHRRGAQRKTADIDVTVWMENWQEVDALFDRLESIFDVNRQKLRLSHRHSGAKIDLCPFGAIEQPPGHLTLYRTERVYNVSGLHSAYRCALRMPLSEMHQIRVPLPGFFVLLKLQSYLDRSALRDLRDAGFVLKQVVADETLWDDAAFVDLTLEETLTIEDGGVWQTARRLSGELSEPERLRAIDVVEQIQALSDSRRLEVVRSEAFVQHWSEDNQAQADRLLHVFRLALLVEG